MPAVSPANLVNWNRNHYYKTEEEYLYAVADALHEEYQAVIAAGLILQIDDPLLTSYYVMHAGDERSTECRDWAADPGRGAQPRAARACRATASATTPATASISARASMTWS